MESMWVTAFFLQCHVGCGTSELNENFATQFPWHLSRYPLALNTCDKSGNNEQIFKRNSKSHDLWVNAVFPRALQNIYKFTKYNII